MSAKVTRRQFLKLSAAAMGGAAIASNTALPVGASSGVDPAKVPAMLVDISRCVGCGNCQRSCIDANHLNPTTEQTKKLTSENFTYLQKVELEGGNTRYVKRQCMHCLDAACASACPVVALHQTVEGPIGYRASRCLGCRMCMVACPFGVPTFQWDDGLTPEIRKCMFCIERQREGELPARVANCPSGALKFGTREELLKEAHARIAANPNHYVDHVFGEHEAGGTAWLYISDTPFEKLGFRTDVTKREVPAYTWDIMSKLPAVVGSLAVVLTGASIVTRRKNGHHDDTPPWSARKNTSRGRGTMLQDILMLGALFILRIAAPLLLVVGVGYTLLQKFFEVKLDFSPKFFTGVGLVLCCWAVAAITLILRFTSGLGAVTNLSDEFPLGLWIGFDVMAGAMLGGGAFVLAGLVYVFGLERYRPILRSTILTAFLGYALLIVALLIDVGRPQNIMLMRPVYFPNIHSVLWEVAMCVLCYTTVLALEFLPAVFERLRWRRMWIFFHKITLPLVIIGILLSTMHQSSLGSLWVIAPGKLHPLWYSPFLPVLFWISAITVGLGMVIVESNLSAAGFKRGLEQNLLASLSKANAGLLAIYAIAKLVDVAMRGQAIFLTQPTLHTVLWWVEVGLGAILPAILLSRPRIRDSKNALFAVGILVVCGGIMNRLNVSVFGMWAYTGPVYVPSLMEVILTVAMFTFGAAVFAVATRYLPVFPKEEVPETVEA